MKDMMACDGIFCLIAVLIAVTYAGINIYLTRKHYGTLSRCVEQKGSLFLLKCLLSFLTAKLVYRLAVYYGLADEKKKSPY